MCVYFLFKRFQCSNSSVLRFHCAVSCFVVFLLEVNQPCLKIRIVSMPCWELFDEQDQEYQELLMVSWHVLATFMEIKCLEYWI